jgi:hypothetical protein
VPGLKSNITKRLSDFSKTPWSYISSLAFQASHATKSKFHCLTAFGYLAVKKTALRNGLSSILRIKHSMLDAICLFSCWSSASAPTHIPSVCWTFHTNSTINSITNNEITLQKYSSSLNTNFYEADFDVRFCCGGEANNKENSLPEITSYTTSL